MKRKKEEAEIEELTEEEEGHGDHGNANDKLKDGYAHFNMHIFHF